MPCHQPFRDDPAQLLLYKIASCLADGGGGVVTSFNGLTGAVTFTGADIATLLGFTPISQADGDSRYVLKAGDTMTGALAIQVTDASVASSPNVLTLTHNLSAGVPLAGLGVSLEQSAETTTTESQRMTRWLTAWLDPVHATRTAQTTFFSVLNGVDAIQLILGNNVVQLGAAGTAAAPSLIFRNDVDTGMYFPVANSIGFSAGGSPIFTISATGVNLTDALAYQYNSVNVIRAQTALFNYFFGPSGNLTMTGVSNISVGANALQSNTTGLNNSAIGTNALFANTTGVSNISIGANSLFSNTTGSSNVAIGNSALQANIDGLNNSAIGTNALFSNTSGVNNVAIGNGSLFNLTTGNGNTAVGYNTGVGITTGIRNTIIGASVTGLAAGLSNNIILADGAGVIRLQIDSSGNTTLAGTVATAAGTAALPAYTFSGDLNTGLYSIGADSVGLSTGGTLRVTTNTTDLLLATGFRLAMASGANTRTGNAVLVAGTVTVANTSVTANTVVLLTRKTAGGTLGTSITYTVIAATSFTITSDSAIDTSTFSYLLIENP